MNYCCWLGAISNAVQCITLCNVRLHSDYQYRALWETMIKYEEILENYMKHNLYCEVNNTMSTSKPIN